MPFPPSTGTSTGDLEAVSSDYPEFEIAIPELPKPPRPSPSLCFVSFFLKKYLTESDCLCRVEADTRRIRITIDHLWSPLGSLKHRRQLGPAARAARTSELPFQAFPFQSGLSRPFGYPTSHNLPFFSQSGSTRPRSHSVRPNPARISAQFGLAVRSAQQPTRPSLNLKGPVQPIGPIRPNSPAAQFVQNLLYLQNCPRSFQTR
ncbi:hypothetical protein CRG98_027032 [Punica granatum]|uniref:Uncharacterized protein n=1 Tax=Punica granatum TaxID=22663 RepID=A0A2I0J9I7_PUNGR|nr:hypothetical protein CRG98_027032 [Punica granatum]